MAERFRGGRRRPLALALMGGIRRHLRGLTGLGFMWVVSTLPVGGQTQVALVDQLKQLSLDELMSVEVTTVSRQPVAITQSPSAVQVVTGQDIHRSGAKTLPEALRLAPNLQVAQHNAYSWAITARGFNGRALPNNSLANKLLVMIDGRSVYTPLFGGVFWDAQNVLLENIDRIEVVSGPGGTLWGANAVNGIINVITKSARDTQGVYLSGGGGSFLQDFGAAQYGGGNGSNLFFRLYGQRFDHHGTVLPNGADAGDSWDLTQGGFRMDYYPTPKNTVTVQGDIYSGSQGAPTLIERLDGQNVLGRWTHKFSDESDLQGQVYYDRTWRTVPAQSFADELNTLDFDVQHRFPVGPRNRVVWGAGYRLMLDEVNNSAPLSIHPAQRSLQVFSGFVQDECWLVPDRLALTLGTKLEHNDYAGLELQPSARLAWRPADWHIVWGAISRAVHSPTRFERDVQTPAVTGNPDFKSETLLAYELGYRVRPVERLSLSVAAFFNEYDHLRSFNFNRSPAVRTPLIFANDQHAETWGFELAGRVQVARWWRWRGGYTYLHENIWSRGTAVVPGSDTFEANDPQQQFLLQSVLDLPAHFQFDAVGRYVDKLPAGNVSAYVALDLRLGWQFKQVELELVGQNLLDPQHREFEGREIPRSVYGQATWRF